MITSERQWEFLSGCVSVWRQTSPSESGWKWVQSWGSVSALVCSSGSASALDCRLASWWRLGAAWKLELVSAVLSSA